MKIDSEKSFLLVVRQLLNTADLFLYSFFHCSFFLCVFVSKQHPVKHAKGRAKLDGVLVAEVTSDTPRKVSCSRLQALIQNTKVAFAGCIQVLFMSVIQNAYSTKFVGSNTLLNCS